MEEAKVYETIDQVVKYLIANPILLGICILVAGVLAVPLLLFIIFAVINVAFAFTGFIVIEGKIFIAVIVFNNNYIVIYLQWLC